MNKVIRIFIKASILTCLVSLIILPYLESSEASDKKIQDKNSCGQENSNLGLNFSGGPPPGRTGGFGDDDCTDCHTSFALNSGPGSLTIDGIPKNYDSGTGYTITVTIAQQGQRRWGFQLAVRAHADSSQAGTLVVTDSDFSQTVDSLGVTFIEHTRAGTRFGTPDGASFTFDWIAPDTSTGTVEFNAAGNAANANFAPTGDYIYTTSVVSEPSTTEIVPGDVNFDDVVDVNDLIAVINFILDLSNPSADQFAAADVTGDGILSVQDLIGIINIILGLG